MAGFAATLRAMDAFTITKKIYYHDTDAEGVVYYAHYLKYLEEARTEHLLARGIDLGRLSGTGIVFAVASLEITYRRPARYGDILTVSSKIEKMKNVSIYYRQLITRDDALLVECATRLVTLGRDFKPTAIPRDVADLLSDESLRNKPVDI